MKKLIRTTLLGLALVTLSQSALALKDGETFQDWQAKCTKDDKGQQHCHIFQNLVAQEGQQTVLHVAIGYVPERKDPAVVLTLPLGISLPPGVGVQIDNEGEPHKVLVEACFPNGCQAGFPLQPDMLQKFRAGKQANIIFFNLKRQPISIPVSLNGFTAASKALEATAGK